MAQEGSVAPKERINIKYVPATNGQQAETELPLRVMVLGDFSDRDSDLPLEERRQIDVDKNNFDAVMNAADVKREFSVNNVLAEETGNELQVSLNFKSLKDFEPDSIVQQVPELKKLIELREALVALKGPLGNMPAFRRRLQQLLEDDASREQLLSELEAVRPNE